MRTYTSEEMKGIRKADAERHDALVQFAKKFHSETFSASKDVLETIVEFKRMARLALRGEEVK